MKIPGFLAEAALYKMSQHYRAVGSLDALVSAAQVQPALRREGFTCNPVQCFCRGDEDCNDMFSTDACGPVAVCFDSTCICSR